MDEATMSGGDDDLPPLGQPPPQSLNHHRRHIRYATPEASTQPPPHFILESAMSSQQSRSQHPHNAHRIARTISASPPPLPAMASASQASHSGGPPPAPGIDGQDHDRMETDEESDRSDSDAEADTPEAGSSEGAPTAIPEGDNAVPPPPGDEEIMDTSPDNPPAHGPPPAAIEFREGIAAPAVLSSEANGGPPALRLVHVQMPGSDGDVFQVEQEDTNAAGRTDIEEERASRLLAAEAELAALSPAQRQEQSSRRERREAEEEGERDDDESDEDTDEEENAYWGNFKEDTSAPDPRELKIIEEQTEEVSALDHEHWEKKAFEPLDDPEYVPGEGHRISWTVTGVNGTPEKPNREKIMRSPSVFLDGYYWNIKYFPRGNDGTEQLSIYIECSPTRWEDVEAEPSEVEASKEAPATGHGPNIVAEAEQTAISNVDAPTAEGPASTVSVNGAFNAPEQEMGATDNGYAAAPMPIPMPIPLPAAEEQAPPVNINGASMVPDEMDTMPIPTKTRQPKEEEPWGIAAQISCVIYNPNEPRVNASQKGCHRYYNDNPDWGWTRFYGPWDEIHKRSQYQRQALLRNDTLAFTAYIRTIRDDTMALWWHPPKDKADWDCVAMTGVKAFECHHQSSAMIAALSSWLHLSPVVDTIRDMHVPDAVWEANERPRPAFMELQDVLDADDTISSTAERELCLTHLLGVLNFYGANVDSKMDVVEIWETLRRILNYEASGLSSIAACNSPRTNEFNDLLLLKQADPFDNDTSPKYQPSPRQSLLNVRDSEPHSVQETIDLASRHNSKAFRMWRSFAGEELNIVQSPSVLHIELHRQCYSKDARKWKKLIHRIEMNENIVFNQYQYTLYGMIVHSGDLESKEYYSVIRPEGPGTRWLKYGGDNSPRRVEVLTTKSAVRAHEGSGDSADGTAAVAYVALYVRTDRLSNVLCTPFKKKITQKPGNHDSHDQTTSEADGPSENKATEEDMPEDMPVYIYSSDIFQEYTGRGMCDPWTEQHRAKWVKELKFSTKSTLAQVKQCIRQKESKDIRLWPMNTIAPSTKAYPGLLSFEAHSSESILEIVAHTGGCRFWMAPGEADPVEATGPLTPTIISEEGRARLAEMEQQAQSFAPSVALLSGIRGVDAAVERVTQAVTRGDDTEMAEAANTLQQQNAQNAQLPNIELEIVAAQAQAPELLQQRSESLRSETAPIKMTYFLLKVFDVESQSLRGVASHLVNSRARISEEAKKLLKVGPHESWDLYHEQGLDIRPKDLIKSQANFETIFGGADGCIIIAQRHPNSTQVAALEAQGKCSNPIEYFHYLHGHDNPTFFQATVTNVYFGHQYSHCSVSMGRAHGQGTLITLAGDAYTGNFTAGAKEGQGKMNYANGDTYTGEWKANEPNGQGRMVYAKTGNVYTGGFKKRKRHGKGQMIFEVADEELHLCKICYEGEMDALFYDCGHVVACEECARQVDQCPVCRKNVRAVVRIWRT